MGTSERGQVDPVVHLHTHSEHSFLDGLGKVEDICRTAAEQDMPAVAITDHGNLSGAWRFQKAADKHGIKSIHGCEFYLAIGSRDDQNFVEVPVDESDMDPTVADVEKGNGKWKPKTKKKVYEHLTVVAENEAGWRNLVTLNNTSHDSFWHKNRIDLDLLGEHSDGLIVFTGCLGGPIASLLMRGDVDGADRKLGELKERLGGTSDPDTSPLFVEIMSHGIDVEDTKVQPELILLARKHNLPMVATNDSHFVHADHSHAHDAWLCLATRSTLAAEKRYRFTGEGYHLRDAYEMRSLFDLESGTEEACNNTLVIARRAADRVLPEAQLRLPRFPIPDGYEPSATAVKRGYTDDLAYLYDQVAEGARRRFGSPLPDEVKARLRFEFDIVAAKGLHSYFLIVQDVCDWARSRGIRIGPGRGSAAGSVISYSLGIVNVDPIANHLLFERFLNPDRTGMPDIDLDFEAERRMEVVNYLRERWGEDSVARIGTFGMARSKRAVRDAARVLEVSKIGDQMSALIGNDKGGKPFGFEALFDDANEQTRDFRNLVADSEEAQRVATIASQFENTVSQAGIHACGILVSDQDLTTLVPTRRDRGKGSNHIEGMLVTEWDGRDIDDFGLLKLDVLGLRNLDVVTRCVEIIRETTGEDVSDLVDDPPYDPSDPRVRAAFDLISLGQTSGVFQLESSGMVRLCQDIRPDSLDDLAAIVALFRPGPLGAGMHERFAARKHGHEPVDYSIFTEGSPNAEAEEEAIAQVLGVTYGVPTFQEQLMQLGSVVAGFDASLRNRLQKAVSKKIKEEMAAVGELFIAGAQEALTDSDGNITKIAFADKTAVRLWDAIKGAGDYAFNRAHSYGYATLAHITALLKANWPAPYAAALLAVTSGKDKRQAVLQAVSEEGITVLPPSVNASSENTSVSDSNTIRLGLSEAKSVGKAGKWIVDERELNGPYSSIHEVARRASREGSKVSTSHLEGLIEAGAFDELSPFEGRTCRAGMTMIARTAQTTGSVIEIEPPDMEWSSVELAAREQDRLGLLLSEHPLAVHGRSDALSTFVARNGMPPQQLADLPSKDGGRFCCFALVTGWTERTYSKGRMASVSVEGPSVSARGVVWDEALTKLRSEGRIPKVGDCVVIDGKVSVRLLDSSSDDEGDGEGEVIEVRELTIWDVEPVALPDDSLMAFPERFDMRVSVAETDLPPVELPDPAPIVEQAVDPVEEPVADSPEPVSVETEPAPPPDVSASGVRSHNSDGSLRFLSTLGYRLLVEQGMVTPSFGPDDSFDDKDDPANFEIVIPSNLSALSALRGPIKVDLERCIPGVKEGWAEVRTLSAGESWSAPKNLVTIRQGEPEHKKRSTKIVYEDGWEATA